MATAAAMTDRDKQQCERIDRLLRVQKEQIQATFKKRPVTRFDDAARARVINGLQTTLNWLVEVKTIASFRTACDNTVNPDTCIQAGHCHAIIQCNFKSWVTCTELVFGPETDCEQIQNYKPILPENADDGASFA